MKIVAKVFGGLVALWLVLLLVGLVLPGHYRVTRSTVIAAPPSTVFARIGDLKAWPAWGVWFARDPAMQLSYSPVTTGIGAWSSWKSKTQGDGKMTITKVAPPEDFEYRMEFTNMGMVSLGTMVVAPGPGGSSQVTMGMEGDLGHSPINRWFGLFMDKLVGPDFDAGLANLKRLSEAAR
jgi:uncharacterized protein YndB with AHSA1/START domain